MSEGQATAACYRWSRDFVVAHAVFASGFVTAPVAVLHLLKRSHSWRALLFAVFAALCTTISLVLCFHFYAELKRPPWPSPPARGGGQQPDGAGGQQESARDDDLRRPETMVRVEMQAALASGRVPSYARCASARWRMGRRCGGCRRASTCSTGSVSTCGCALTRRAPCAAAACSRRSWSPSTLQLMDRHDQMRPGLGCGPG